MEKSLATIYIRSNQHPRTINTPCMARTYFTAIPVFTKEELFSKAEQLEKAGERITDITANPSILKEFYRKKRQQRG